MTVRTVSDKPLRVAPEFVGATLASPMRRAVAFGVDLVVVMIPSIAVGVAAAALALSISDPQAFAGFRALLHRGNLDAAARHAAVKSVLPTLARHQAPGLPAAARAAVEEGKLEEAADAVRDYEYEFSLQIGEWGTRPPGPKRIRVEVGELIPPSVRALALYGVVAAYFTLFLATGRGQTPGKRLTGIRVVRLDGHRLSLFESLERFVGYLHIPATLGISLIDLWRDPNRRMPHDRTVHTAVLRVAARAKTRA